VLRIPDTTEPSGNDTEALGILRWVEGKGGASFKQAAAISMRSLIAFAFHLDGALSR